MYLANDSTMVLRRRNLKMAGMLALDPLEARTLLSLQGNVLFPRDNPWNQKINNAPVAANSAALVNSIGPGSPLHPDFGQGLLGGGAIGIPYNVVSGNQAKIPVVLDAYASESDPVDVPIPPDAVIDGDPSPADLNTGDRHLIVYDKDHNVVYELFNVHRPVEEEADHQWHADSEAVWDLSKNSFRTPTFTSADAAGLPILPGLVRPDEVLDQGVINHAIRFTVPKSRNAFVFPASHQAGVNNDALPRMGERFRLKQSFDISGYSVTDRVILQALKDYGMILADNGSSWFISGVPSERWDNDELHAITRIHGSSFEAVDLTPVVSGLDQASGPSAGGTQVMITGLNYSGAVGQLKVFFGTTAATAVTIASDGSVTVTTPARAASMVDVTVQTPYGTSTILAADQFTYTGTPTPPAAPGSPNPPAASTLQKAPTVLNWADSAGASSYDVYYDNVLRANVAASQWTLPAPITVNTPHVWYIVAKGAGGSTTGSSWSFQVNPIKADANADGIVDISDFKIVNDHYGQPGDWSMGDFNGDGLVEFSDFQILELNFGNRTTAGAQPVWASAQASSPAKGRETFSLKPIRRPQAAKALRRDAGFGLR